MGADRVLLDTPPQFQSIELVDGGPPLDDIDASSLQVVEVLNLVEGNKAEDKEKDKRKKNLDRPTPFIAVAWFMGLGLEQCHRKMRKVLEQTFTRWMKDEAMCALRGWKSFESELKRIQLERWSKSDSGARSSSDTTNVRDFEEDWIKLWSDMKDDMRKGKFDAERIQWCDKPCDKHSHGELLDPYCGRLQARVAWQEVTLFPDPSRIEVIDRSLKGSLVLVDERQNFIIDGAVHPSDFKKFLDCKDECANPICKERDREDRKLIKCTACVFVKYCIQECQNLDWKRHKRYCNIYQKRDKFGSVPRE